MAVKQQHYCEKCRKMLGEANFYTLRDGNKASMCKSCLTMHVDNFDPSTYEWIFKYLDIPYLPDEWERIRNREVERDPAKANGGVVLGKYISFTKLKQWRNSGFEDSERLMREKEEKIAQFKKDAETEQEEVDDLKQQYLRGEISEAQYKTLLPTQLQQAEINENPIYRAALAASQNGYAVPEHDQELMDDNDFPDLGKELTKDDKIYLGLKWGRNYTPSEWVELEKLYEEFMDSFDITDVDSRNNILLICKTYHKMNLALDSGDYDAYNRLNKTYESLRKTAKLTAAQNKNEKDDYVDCIGNMVVICEKEGYIERLETETTRDAIDFAIKDIKGYCKTFAEQNMNLSQQLESYLQRIQIQDETEREMDEDDGSPAMTKDEMNQFFNDTTIEEDIIGSKEILEAQNDVEGHVKRGTDVGLLGTEGL